MIRTLADPWLAQNAGRKYPLADDADTEVPDNALLDFRCTVRGAAVDSSPIAALGLVTDDGTELTLCVDVVWYLTTRTLKFKIPHNLAGPYIVPAETDGVTGVLTVTEAVLELVKPYPYHLEGLFARTTVVVDSLGVDSLVSYADPGQHHIDGNADATLSGEIVLDLGANTDPYLDGRRLRLEIAKGGGRGEWCQHQEADQNCGNVLFTVNGERPGSDGDLKLVGEGGITVTPKPEEHTLEISIEKASSDLMAKDCTTAC